ncbi:MAG: cupredoxin domain-containing protein [Candidatus Rokuibacteriota bacterium]
MAGIWIGSLLARVEAERKGLNRTTGSARVEGWVMTWARRMALVTLLLSVAGCAGAPAERAARPLPAGRQVIRIELSGFTFRPDVVTARAGMPLTITAASESRIPHDITILALDGSILKRVDVPPKQTVAFDVTLTTPGRYVFYCSKFLHRRPFGMDGVLVVTQ